jgi:TonB family protein
MTSRPFASTVALTLVLIAPAAARAQDSLGPIRALYASAEYEEALSAIGRLKSDSGAAASTVEVDRYRALCLIALGRSAEADQAIEAIVKGDPLYQPAAGEASPRVRATFSEVRRRVLPGLVRALYADAKAAYERKSMAEAAEKLEKTLKVIDDPDCEGQELGDLRLLVVGFLDLAKAAAPASTSSAPAPNADASAPSAAPGTGSTPAPAAAAPAVINAVALKQDMPKWNLPNLGSRSAEYRGWIEVEIDEQGTVVNATITDPVHPMYDPLLLKAARDWKYEPARRGGQAIKSTRRVEVVLRNR